MLLLLITVFFNVCYGYKINSHQQHYNIFTIQHHNETLSLIKNYSYNDIEKYKLDIDHHMNMYSSFTKSYFERCHNYNDPNCEYDLEDQEEACQIYMVDMPKNHEYPPNVEVKRTIYYYGTYNNQLSNYMVNSDGTVYKLNKADTVYETKGMYIVEDLIRSDDHLDTDVSSCKFKLHKYQSEPDDFHRKMMLYVVPVRNKIIFCPYWEMKPDYLI